MWLLPPIALQILHCLDDADDAHAFLVAAPKGSLDDALDALRTLLAMDLELPLWPTAHIASLNAASKVDPSVVTKALPLFRKILVSRGEDYAKLCHTTKLPPTTSVSASVDAANIRGVLGKWLPNLAVLRVVSQSTLAPSAVIKDSLSACHGLRALIMDQFEVLFQDTLDTALAVVVAACPHLERLVLHPYSLSCASDYAALLAWLALPTARHLSLEGTDSRGELGAELATCMLASNTLETIELLEVPSLTRAILCPSALPLPWQLRHFKIKDYAKYNNYDSYDNDSDEPYDAANADAVDVHIDRPPLFGDTDIVALAAKVATARLESLELRLETRCDVTSVMTVLPPTLTKLALQSVTLTSCPPLRQLWHLELCAVRLSNEAIVSLASWLHSFPKLVELRLGSNQFPDRQAETIVSALPAWLSHRGTACTLHLAIESDACVHAFTAALSQTRNTHKVTLAVGAYYLSLEAKQQLVMALGSTSRMMLAFHGTKPTENDVLEDYGRQHHLEIAHRREYPLGPKRVWFISPSRASRTSTIH